MSNAFQKILKITVIILFGIYLPVFAGTFTPNPVSPDAGDYTLSDIYNKITDPDFSYSAHTFAPAVSPAGTFVTLTQIWNAIPSFITLVADDLDTGILPAGMYATNFNLKVIEPNLAVAHGPYIRAGTEIFGVAGECVPPPDCTPHYVVSGTLTPDVTGDYYDSGGSQWNGQIRYVLSGSSESIWLVYRSTAAEAWEITQNVGANYLFRNALGGTSNIVGTYTNSELASGTATVTNGCP